MRSRMNSTLVGVLTITLVFLSAFVNMVGGSASPASRGAARWSPVPHMHRLDKEFAPRPWSYPSLEILNMGLTLGLESNLTPRAFHTGFSSSLLRLRNQKDVGRPLREISKPHPGQLGKPCLLLSFFQTPLLPQVSVKPPLRQGGRAPAAPWRWAALAWPPGADLSSPTPSSCATPMTCSAAWRRSTTSVPATSMRATWWSRPPTTAWVLSGASAAAPGPTAASPRYWAEGAGCRGRPPTPPHLCPWLP